MSDSTLNRFLASGTAAERAAFTPDPQTPASGPDPTYVWLETDTGNTYAWDFGGAAWVQVNSTVSGVYPPFDPPLAADFTNSFGTVAPTLSDDADIGLVVNCGASVTGDAQRYKCKALPAGDFNLIVEIAPTIFTANFNGYGVCLVESATNKSVLFERQWSGGDLLTVSRLTIPTGFVSNPYSTAFASVRFFRVERSSTTLNWYTSGDGKNWVLQYTESLTAYFTTAPNYIGLGCSYNNGGGKTGYLSCRYWNQNW